MPFLRPIYGFSFVVGIAILVYIYGVKFEFWSEGELITYAPIWLLPLTFGLYGLLAEWVSAHLGKEEKPDEVFLMKLIIITLLTGVVLMLPLLLVKKGGSLLVAFAGCAFCIGIYYFITGVIWHLL